MIMGMSAESLIIMLVVGAVAGWLAGQVVRGGSGGLAFDIIVGIVGSIIGGWVFSRMGIFAGPGVVGAIITSAAGAIILLIGLKFLQRR